MNYIKKGEIQNEYQYQKALVKFKSFQKELQSKILEQMDFKTRASTEEHMLIAMDKSIHAENFFQYLQTNNEQFKVTVTFLTSYNDIFDVTSKKTQFLSTSVFEFAENNTISILPGAKELQSLIAEIRRIILEEGKKSEEIYPSK